MHTVAGNDPTAGLIMIAEKIVRLPANGVPVNFVQQPAEIRRGEFVDVGNLEIHRQLHLVILGAVHFGELGDIWLIGSLIITGLPGYAFTTFLISRQNFVDFRQVVRVFVGDIRVTVGILPWENRIIVEIGIFKQTRDRVDSKPRHAAFQPEAHGVIHGFAHLRIAQFRSGCSVIEMVVVILIRGGSSFHAEWPNQRLPVVECLAHRVPSRTNIPIARFGCCAIERDSLNQRDAGPTCDWEQNP